MAFEILIKLVCQWNKTQSDTHNLTETELTINKEIKLATKHPQQGSEPCKCGD